MFIVEEEEANHWSDIIMFNQLENKQDNVNYVCLCSESKQYRVLIP